MIAAYNHRTGRVEIVMMSDEFTETVEWLENIDPHDGATAHWRAEHDRIMPRPEEEEDGSLP